MLKIDIQKKWEQLSKHNKEFNFRDFANLDQSSDANYLVQSMYDLYALPEIQRIKQHAIEALKLKEGDAALEVGCGLGHDVEIMSPLVGNTGSVIGIDKSNLMLAEASRRSQQRNIQFQQGDATNLEFNDNTFSVGYADRLLVSQKQPDKVISELIRVVKPNGIICITDIDVGSIVLYPYHAKLTHILKMRWEEIVANPYIGRELQYKFKQKGLINIKVIPDSYIVKSLDTVNKMIDYPRMIYDLYKMGRYTKDEALIMLEELYAAEQEGMFLYGIIFFTVSGIKPT